MKYCSKCGYENVDEAKFCRNCGEKLKAAADDMGQNQAIFDIGETKDPEAPSKVIVNKNEESIVSKLFYKKDKYTGELRIAKAKTISIAVFVLVFLFSIYVNLPSYSLLITLFAAVIAGLFYAVPTYIIGYILGIVIDRIYLMI